jgi:hypothetical protein
MLDQQALIRWINIHRWSERYDPSRLQMALHQALVAVRRAHAKREREVPLTGIFFSAFDNACDVLDQTYGPSLEGPIMDALTFGARNKKTSLITETRTGADFAVGFWQPDRTLRLAIFQAKVVEDDQIDIRQTHDGTGAIQALALLSTALRAPYATDHWAAAYWVHYVGWAAQAWEPVWQLSELTSRLAKIAGIELTDVQQPQHPYVLPLAPTQPRFFDVLSAGAGQAVPHYPQGHQHWLTLTLDQVKEERVFLEMVEGMQTYFIFDRRSEAAHRDAVKVWIAKQWAERGDRFAAVPGRPAPAAPSRPGPDDEDDDTTGAAPGRTNIRLPLSVVTPAVALENAPGQMWVPDSRRGALTRAMARVANSELSSDPSPPLPPPRPRWS